MPEKIIATVTRKFRAPDGYKGDFYVTAEAHQIGGNKHPYFSVTGEISTPRQHDTGDWQAGGCLHEYAAKAWPAIAPIIALHLANADDGEPMHAEKNGWYWLAGAMGGVGEEYHGASGSSGKSADECLQIFADLVRIPLENAQWLVEELRKSDMPQATFRAWIEAQRARWAAEARAGLELIRTLAAQSETREAK